MTLLFPCCHKLFEPDWTKCADFIKHKKPTQEDAELHPEDQGEAIQTEAAPSHIKKQADYAKLATHASAV